MTDDAAGRFALEIKSRLPYVPNSQQSALVDALARFVFSSSPDPAFIVNGYAGTGKTSLTGALVGALEASGRKAILLAPTGRAAKVFSANSRGHAAATIHRRIYRHSFGAGGAAGYAPPAPAENRERNAVFIVDEASMIGTADEHGNSLLHDLVQYVFTGTDCRLILLGDTAQLPPVGAERSPAMEPEVLRRLGLRVSAATLTATARQAADSGILFNATRLRRTMAACKASGDEADVPLPRLRAPLHDVAVVDPSDLPEILADTYARDGIENTILITRSNRRAADYNASIRAQVLYREEEISREDLLIVAKNHYFRRKTAGVDFIANGDMVMVERVYGTEVRYGLRFADVSLRLGDAEPFDIKIILDTLASGEAAMAQQQWIALYNGILNDDGRFGATPPSERLGALATDPYWNALQVKYGYAVTCHKAQGGQWTNVFVDLAYIPADALGLTLYRWLYTAVTRARTRLYLIAPPDALMEAPSATAH